MLRGEGEETDLTGLGLGELGSVHHCRLWGTEKANWAGLGGRLWGGEAVLRKRRTQPLQGSLAGADRAPSRPAPCDAQTAT